MVKLDRRGSWVQKVLLVSLGALVKKVVQLFLITLLTLVRINI